MTEIEPRWKDDFPFKTEIEEYVTRRDFLRFLLIVSSGFVFGNFFIFLKTLESKNELFHQLDLGPESDLLEGTSKTFHYPTENDPALLIRRANGEYIAFHQKCPHLACPVTYHPEEGESIRCHCHNGLFDINTGRGIQGPPREFRPLREVLLKRQNGRLLAVGLS